MKNPIASETLRSDLYALLDQSVLLSPEYGNGLSSHLPMALEALSALGADGARLREFATHYATRLERSSTLTPDAMDSEPVLGRFGDFALWRRHYAERLSLVGRDAMLLEALPVLMPGVAAAAFHGLIRVGHAVRAGHDGELASALAYWASRHQVTKCDTGQPPLDAAAWLSQLRELAHQRPSPTDNLIFSRMAAWANHAEFRRLAARLPVADLPKVAAAAAEHYVATRNFTLLHVVTATAALQRLSPWLTSDLWEQVPAAVAAAWLASGGLSDDPQPIAEYVSIAWPSLAAAATAVNDDHAIKLVLACRELDALYPATVWRLTAARALEIS
jgi:hypothetical protein